MMKQRELGLRGRMRLHAVAALSMGLAAALTVSAAGAEARPARLAHPRAVLEATHGKPSGVVGRRLVATGSVKRSSVKTSASVKSARAASHPAAVHGGVGAAKTASNARTRRPEHLAPATVAQPIPVHRAKAEPGRNLPLKKYASATVAVAQDPKPLTVDDFTRAAQGADAASGEAEPGSGGGIYARGESHPEDDEQVPATHLAAPAAKPTVAKRPVAAVKAPMDAVEDNAPLPNASVVRDDRVSSIASARESDAEPAAGLLHPATRQELTEELEQPVVLPGLYRNGRLVVPAPLKGTREILVHQNLMADDEGLERIQDDDDLRRLRAAHLLVNFTESASLRVNPELAADRRCARVWTVRFASDIARAFYARFHEPLQVNSAVRTVAYQVRLQRTNGNAAGIDGEVASPHLTGQAMDLGKRGMSVAQIAWMRAYLLPLMQAGKIDVEEEFQQACFHISVYRTYLPAAPAKRRVPRNEVAQLREPRVVKSAPRGDELR